MSWFRLELETIDAMRASAGARAAQGEARIFAVRALGRAGEGAAAELFARPQSEYTRALFAAAFELESAGEGVVAQ